MSRISVIGLDGSPLSARSEKLLRQAEVVAGGRRHLEAAGVEPGRSVVLEGDLSSAMSRLEGAESGVVLASGDPGYFGIVRALAERFGRKSLDVTPALSSVALASSRAGIPWDDAVTVSAHGRDPRRAMNVCRAYPKVAVLTSPEFGRLGLRRVCAPTAGKGRWSQPRDWVSRMNGCSVALRGK